ncbi:unnamed protein product [Discosporangium mesarthrocarpum]
MKDGKKVYLQPDEEVPKPPRVSNKRFILKIMFLAAVARPRKLFNGIDTWPIFAVFTAQRASRSRAGGDLFLRPVTVEREKNKKILIDKVIPAIKDKMARPPFNTTFVKQDGAKPHTKKGVTEAIQAEAGKSIVLET